MRPFTVDHFRAYTGLMVLDNGDYWPLEDFQAEIVDDVFKGFPETWVIIPEGNAKTTLMGGVALYHADFTESANCLVAAASRDQAGILFGQAAGLVQRSPGFENRFRVFEGYRRIVAHRSHGRIQVMAADDRTGDGAIPSLGLVDEPHRMRDLRLYRTWRGKLDKRGGQLVAISTAGEPGSEFEGVRARMHSDAVESTTDGCHTRSVGTESIIHDWRVPPGKTDDMETVKAANPLSTITVETLERRRRSPSMTAAHWSRFVCNVATRESGQWLEDRAGWDRAAKSGMEIPAGAEVVLFYDPAYHFDSAALVALEPTGEWQGRAAPVKIFDPSTEDGGTVQNWKVKAAILEACQRWRVKAVGYDFNRGFVEAAEELGMEHGIPMVRVPMSSAIWAPLTAAMRAAIHAGHFEHPADPVFTSHVMNGETKDSPHGPRLHGRTPGKVDALISLGGCCFLAWGTPGDPEHKRSPYETKDLLILS